MTAIALPAKLDLSTISALATDLRAAQGGALELDASAVTQLGGLGVQLLGSAARTWREAGHSLTIHPRSDSFDEALTIFGVALEDLQATTEAA